MNQKEIAENCQSKSIRIEEQIKENPFGCKVIHKVNLVRYDACRISMVTTLGPFLKLKTAIAFIMRIYIYSSQQLILPDSVTDLQCFNAIIGFLTL